MFTKELREQLESTIEELKNVKTEPVRFNPDTKKRACDVEYATKVDNFIEELLHHCDEKSNIFVVMFFLRKALEVSDSISSIREYTLAAKLTPKLMKIISQKTDISAMSYKEYKDHVMNHWKKAGLIK